MNESIEPGDAHDAEPAIFSADDTGMLRAERDAFAPRPVENGDAPPVVPEEEPT